MITKARVGFTSKLLSTELDLAGLYIAVLYLFFSKLIYFSKFLSRDY